MDSRTDTQNSNICQQESIIQSASASTACQTNSSKFVYVLTASILGVIALLIVAIVLLMFAIGISSIQFDPHDIDSRGDMNDYGYLYEDTHDFESPYDGVWL